MSSSTSAGDSFSPRLVGAAAAMVFMLTAGVASAQPDPTAGKRADALFTEGKALVVAKDYAHACPKLAESYAIDPANGTLIALALCHEGLGRTASAWREFLSAADGAAKEGRKDRAQFARDHAVRLEGKLSYLTVVAPGDAPSGTQVTLDGTLIAQADLGKPWPVDPGRHTIDAETPDKRSWSGSVDIAPERDAQTVTVGALVPAAVAPTAIAPAAIAPASAQPATDPPPPRVVSVEPPAALPEPRAAAPGAWRRPAGWAFGGAGLAVIGVGAAFGVAAISKSADAKSRCSPSSCLDAGAVKENGDANTFATVADVVIASGIAVAALGAYFLLSAPSTSPAAVRVTPIVGPSLAAVSLQRTW